MAGFSEGVDLGVPDVRCDLVLAVDSSVVSHLPGLSSLRCAVPVSASHGQTQMPRMPASLILAMSAQHPRNDVLRTVFWPVSRPHQMSL